MDELEFVPLVFAMYYSGYHCRAIWRLYRRGPTGPYGRSLSATWLKNWRSPNVLRGALRCTIRSSGVFLGIKIADDKESGREESSTPGPDHH